MTLKLITPNTVEPISLTELKQHLRLDVSDSDISVDQSIAPGSHGIAASYSLLGSTITVNGYSATVVLNAGAVGSGGSVAVKIQDSINGTVWADVASGAFTTITASNDNQTFTIAYEGDRPYIRAVATVAVAACEFSVDVTKQANNSYEDDVLNGMIAAARSIAEGYQKRQLMEATYTDTFCSFGCRQFLVHPVTEIVEVKYYDSDNVQQTLDDEVYILDTTKTPAVLKLGYNQSWPATFSRPDAVEVTLLAGYESAADVPQSTKHAILMLAGTLYTYRNSEQEVNLSQMRAVETLLACDCWC